MKEEITQQEFYKELFKELLSLLETQRQCIKEITEAFQEATKKLKNL